MSRPDSAQLDEELASVRYLLGEEQTRCKDLEVELDSERETIEDLLTKLELLELGARASKEQTLETVQRLEMELHVAKKSLDDERSIRLQLHYESSQSKNEAEDALREKQRAQKALVDMESDQRILVTEMDALRTALETSKCIIENNERDLKVITAANLSLKNDAHLLRMRLVEAEAETSLWRRKHEEALGAAARDRDDLGVMYAELKKCRGARKALVPAPEKDLAPSRPPRALAAAERGPAAAPAQRAVSNELPALFPPGYTYK